MIHRRKGRKLKRTASHRSALMSNLSASLILNKRISTTEAKAKELRLYIEPLVTKARKALRLRDSSPEKSVHLRREARKFLENKDALNILFGEISVKVGDRPGGYTRVLKTGNRAGDGARTAIIEFVDYNYVEQKQEKQKEKEAAQGDKADTKKSDEKKASKKVKTTEPKAKSDEKKPAKPKKKKEGAEAKA
ncbi:MAG: 50S ribosomal protein L17 [Ignavibacteria bacterium]|nr:50S ribosomal protein L17 [Ignavibacteria bacterium]